MSIILENRENKVTAWQETPTDIAYPTEKLVKEGMDTIETRIETIKGTGWTDENLVDHEGRVQTLESNKEDKSNKVSSWQATPDDTHFPSEKLTKDELDMKENLANKKSTLSENSEVYYPNQKAVNDGLNLTMAEMMGFAPRNLMDVFGTLTVPATFEALRNYLEQEDSYGNHIDGFRLLRLGDYIDLETFQILGGWYNGAAEDSTEGNWLADSPIVGKSSTEQNTRVEIVGFNDYRYIGLHTYFSTPHVTFQFKNLPLIAPMHKLNESPYYQTSQGYTGSDLKTKGLANWYTAIASQFGTATPYDIDRSVATVDSYEWCGDEKLFLPTAMNVFGTPGYVLSDTGVRTQAQFPLYVLNPNKRMKRLNGTVRPYWWLAEPSAGSPNSFTDVINTGVLSSHDSYRSSGVAPTFLI